MQIIVDDHTEMKYYKRCLEQINNKYSQDAEINKCTVIDICNLCIETLVQDFITLLDRYRNPQDIFQFMLLYSRLATEKQRTEDMLILMQMCRYVFILIPKLNLSFKAAPIIDMDKLELSDIFFITKMIDILSQQRAIQLMNDECVFKLERNEWAFALTYMDDSLVNVHSHLKYTSQSKFLFQKHCFSFNLLNDFRGELYNAFGDITDKFCDIVCNAQPANIHLNDVSFIDNNLAENAIRPLTLSRKNFLFCGNHEAAENTAVICSLLATCKAQEVNTREWLNDVIARLPYYQEKDSGKDIRELLPDVWKLKKSNENPIEI